LNGLVAWQNGYRGRAAASGILRGIQGHRRHASPAASVQELTIMLSGAKSSVPEPVFQSIRALYASLLPAEEWKKLKERVLIESR